MSDWKFTTIERRGSVAVVRFDRREALNALNAALMIELTEVAQSFHHDHQTRAIVLTGTAKGFSAGADLREQPAPGTFAESRDRNRLGRRLCRAWEETPQIVTAAIEGPAVGGAVALAISCDWRVMGRSAFLYVPEVKIGVPLQWQAMPKLINLVGPARAKRIVILCERMSAAQALNWGLADEIAEDGSAVEAALKLAEAAAAMPGDVVTITKEAINATANALNHVASFMDSDVGLLCRGSEPAIEARRAFREGRSR
jgi:enoyl-CoA hydratase